MNEYITRMIYRGAFAPKKQNIVDFFLKRDKDEWQFSLWGGSRGQDYVSLACLTDVSYVAYLIPISMSY